MKRSCDKFLAPDVVVSCLTSVKCYVSIATLTRFSVNRKFFVDALPMVGTEATITMMTQMMTSDDVTGVEADMWLTSLALIQEPSAGMLEQVKSLLKNKKLQEKAMLPISTMINNFCQRHDDCSYQPAVQSIMGAFEDIIGSSCYVNKKNLDQVCEVHVIYVGGREGKKHNNCKKKKKGHLCSTQPYSFASET